MGEGQRDGWQWANVPVPESHVAGLLVGRVIHSRVPVSATANQRLARAVGWPLIGIGLLLIGGTVRTIREPDGCHPRGLKTTGPYAFTRNPMYVGWTALYLGLALVLNTAWLFVVFSGVVTGMTRISQSRGPSYRNGVAEDDYGYISSFNH